MRRIHLLFALAAGCYLNLGGPLCADEPKALPAHPTFGRIERLDPRFDDLIPKDAKLEKLAEGFAWSEGPVWNRKEGFLLFSDIPRNRVMKWQNDALSVFLEPSGYTGAASAAGRSVPMRSPTIIRAASCSVSTATAAWRG